MTPYNHLFVCLFLVVPPDIFKNPPKRNPASTGGRALILCLLWDATGYSPYISTGPLTSATSSFTAWRTSCSSTISDGLCT